MWSSMLSSSSATEGEEARKRDGLEGGGGERDEKGEEGEGGEAAEEESASGSESESASASASPASSAFSYDSSGVGLFVVFGPFRRDAKSAEPDRGWEEETKDDEEDRRRRNSREEEEEEEEGHGTGERGAKVRRTSPPPKGLAEKARRTGEWEYKDLGRTLAASSAREKRESAE